MKNKATNKLDMGPHLNKSPKPAHQIDDEKWSYYYEQACEGFRHYSLHVREIRTVSIAQGITVLAGAGYLLGEGHKIQSICVIGLGFLLTLTLWSMHKMYFDHSMIMQEYISETLEQNSGPWSNHRRSRKKRLEGKLKHQLFKHGVFLLLTIALLTMMFLVIFNL